LPNCSFIVAATPPYSLHSPTQGFIDRRSCLADTETHHMLKAAMPPLRRVLLLAILGSVFSPLPSEAQLSANMLSAQNTLPTASKSLPEVAELYMKPLSELVAVIAVGVAAYQYRRAVTTRHAEWLLSLFQSFYETTKYQRIRSILDWPHSPRSLQLASDLTNLKNSSDLQRLDLYLNFFEFVAVLNNRGELKEREVNALFQYYLDNLRAWPTVMAYIKNEGFENLDRLLTTTKRDTTKA
jgi:hypothetical protein